MDKSGDQHKPMSGPAVAGGHWSNKIFAAHGQEIPLLMKENMG
ncbi:hypothetical protein QP835_11435 [Pseudomonas oryzihabitans]|nr:hypothetical protein [Pseudomonas oryzihabitans]MDK8264889.1 hypothetical protein [Pseudomonas oryzihabitans]